MTTTRRRTASTPAAAPASRALLAAGLAAVVTFSLDHGHTARFGLLVLGVYLVLQAVLLAAWSRRLARTRTGLLLLLARSAVSLVGGVLALVQPDGGIGTLRPIEILVFLIVGALEVAGGLQVVVGLMVVILNADPLFSVGVLGAWAALVTVYLGISAANVRVKRRRTA